MYHMAVCDDDKVFISYIRKIFSKANGTNQYQYKIYEFYSGEELISSLDTNKYFDLLILDMELGGIDGDETARKFREKFKDTVLVFCSGMRAPTVKSFKVTPYRYLMKSYSDRQFVCEMKEILSEVAKKSKEEYIIGHYRNNVIRVNIQDILYVENAKRGSKIMKRIFAILLTAAMLISAAGCGGAGRNQRDAHLPKRQRRCRSRRRRLNSSKRSPA